MSKKKIGIIVAVVIIIAAAGGGAWYFLNGNLGVGNSADKVYVEKVSTLNSVNSGVQNRYSGVVEAQESWKVNRDMEREVKELFVEEGDMVEEGAQLFEYDMDDVKSEISQAELELEGYQNEITDYQNQITQLNRERNSASSEEKFQYTTKIQEKENSIKQTEYNIESKKAEIEKKRESIENAIVTSKIAGVVKSINENGSDSGDDSAYITVLAVGDYRVKGTVSESNVQMLSEQQQVILRSRIDEEQTWTGTITKIDTQNESSDSSDDMMMYDSGGTEKATKYPFYVTLDDTDGLMMGQHLFIELDEGQTEEKEGIWLFEGYIVQEGMNTEGEDAEFSEEGLMEDGESDAGDSMEDGESGAEDSMEDEDAESSDEGFIDDLEAGDDSFSEDLSETDADNMTDEDMGMGDFSDAEGLDEDADGASDMEGLEDGETGTEGPEEESTGVEDTEGPKVYVWAANEKNKLEKRPVELGEYDEMTGEYEILSGLTEDDYIAFPMEGLYEGITTVTNVEDVDYTSPLYNQGEEGEESEDGESSEDGGMMGDDEMFNDSGMMDEDGSFDGESYDDEDLDDDTSEDTSGDGTFDNDVFGGDESSDGENPFQGDGTSSGLDGLGTL